MRRTAQHSEIPPPLELECLKVLWDLGQANVKSVREVVTRRRNLAYTTVMTVLDRLARRGIVSRRRVGRSFLYAPLVGRETVQRLAVRDLAEGLFGGSQEDLERFIRTTDWSAPPAATLVPARPEPPGETSTNPSADEVPLVQAAAVAAADGSPRVAPPPVAVVETPDPPPLNARSVAEPEAVEDHLDAALL